MESLQIKLKTPVDDNGKQIKSNFVKQVSFSIEINGLVG